MNLNSNLMTVQHVNNVKIVSVVKLDVRNTVKSVLVKMILVMI